VPHTLFAVEGEIIEDSLNKDAFFRLCQANHKLIVIGEFSRNFEYLVERPTNVRIEVGELYYIGSAVQATNLHLEPDMIGFCIIIA
jgi:hypothetical protein